MKMRYINDRFKIVKPKSEDFSEIFPLLEQLWSYKKFNKKMLKRIFISGLNRTQQQYLIAKQGRKILGFAALTITNSLWDEGNSCYIDALVVDRNHRGRGVGRELMKTITKIAKKKKCKSINFDSALFRKNAHSFYKEQGFKKYNAFLFSKSI
jgi:PhnO protein